MAAVPIAHGDHPAVDEAARVAEQAIADLVAHRSAPGLHVSPSVFNAMEAAASAWLTDPTVRVSDLLAYLVRQADRSSAELRSPALDHIAVAESYLFADLTEPLPAGGSLSLVEIAARAGEQLAVAAPDGMDALRVRSQLAAWPARHTSIGVVAVVLSPSLTADDPDLSHRENSERVVLLLRAIADGARRMLRADRALVALRTSYGAALGAPASLELEWALDVALTQLVVCRQANETPAPSGRLTSASAVRVAPALSDGVVTAMADRGWLVPAERVGGALGDLARSSLWVAGEAFERISSAFADAHVEHLDPSEIIVLPPPPAVRRIYSREEHHAR